MHIARFARLAVPSSLVEDIRDPTFLGRPSSFKRRQLLEGNLSMAFYEHVVISRPDVSPQQVETLVEELTAIVTEKEGTVAKTEYWGLRNLAYPINKARKGHYSLLNIDAPPAAIQEIERRLLINEDVIRFLTIKVDELSEEPSPVLSRKDRGDKGDRGDRGERRPRRDREDS